MTSIQSYIVGLHPKFRSIGVQFNGPDEIQQTTAVRVPTENQEVWSSEETMTTQSDEDRASPMNPLQQNQMAHIFLMFSV